MNRTTFIKVSSLVHLANAQFLDEESKRSGESVSEIVNSAVSILRRMQAGEPPLGVRL